MWFDAKTVVVVHVAKFGEVLVGDNLPNDLNWERELLFKAMCHDPIPVKYISGKLESVVQKRV